jgi:hypothetical protein
MKNQLSFNKMIETQLAWLAASLPSSESGGIPGQPEPTRENVSDISSRWGKPSRRMYAPNHVGKLIHQIQDPWNESEVLHKKDNGYLSIKNALCDLGASVNNMPKAMFEESTQSGVGWLACAWLGAVGWCPDEGGVRRERGGGNSNRRRRHGGCGFLEEESLRQGDGGSWESPIY